MSNRSKLYIIKWFNQRTQSFESTRVVEKTIGGALRRARLKHGASIDGRTCCTSKPFNAYA